jgi:hypothetical protein
MNPTAHQERVRAFEKIYGPCTCDLYGTCVFCVALSETNGFPTFNAAATGLWSVYQHRGEEPDLNSHRGRPSKFHFRRSR